MFGVQTVTCVLIPVSLTHLKPIFVDFGSKRVFLFETGLIFFLLTLLPLYLVLLPLEQTRDISLLKLRFLLYLGLKGTTSHHINLPLALLFILLLNYLGLNSLLHLFTFFIKRRTLYLTIRLFSQFNRPLTHLGAITELLSLFLKSLLS